ncbi:MULTISPECIES: CBS and ACT domain-containing protein [Desulfococcus]|uniref:Putative signal transduction protein with CBS domain containing protein n=1 Tax=Desulfococcus multivorans DSM 2059 TaxID=1121405 RepID=S7UTE0_DESML|nr:CBS and ACT domain-containing protein [Desulfococcus multivorans]AQV00366.1 acetoin utilization protein AcuB [Desulfococcus multivorans]EPR37294.1 putative signal transduction protein with CBS domain containing protein [Desulfococcus multivorans DSM 2059]SJZ70058.1 acetoin utilization protein AcuB [Desulfococcus multivorans DSM 2059]
MYVGRVMHTDLVTVTPETPVAEARDILVEKSIDHLLVVDKKGRLKGIISDRDIKQSWASPATSLSVHELNYLLSRLTVDMVMIRKIISISPDTTIERAALLMQENRIRSLPVMEDDRLVGIITTTDVMGVLLSAIGIDQDSRRFVVLVDRDRIGSVAEITNILKEKKVNILSLFAWPDKGVPGVYHLVMRVPSADGDRAVSALTTGGFKVLTGYVKDITPYLPSP